eukprot:CAMPEP_0168197272 /NCGR_PEP_ID=MMETSP0139_2-20121125/21042_1 /TAXON_ID=44445 /ORGANISM="Pseudo-nitzschia australis, Strain 10249 10 AB" /LENGTH=582 /DNA_ID=CAMNT_0008121665 /DNA_START=230 /DNA_END=1978 /DNA_ORIENTATION=+
MSNVYALDFLRQEHVLDEVGSGRNSRYSSSHHKNSNNDDDDDDDRDTIDIEALAAAAANKPDLEKQHDIMNFLKAHRSAGMMSPTVIFQRTGIDLEEDTKVAQMLMNNNKINVETVPDPENPVLTIDTYAYQATYNHVRDRKTLLAQINTSKDGVLMKELEDSYDTVQDDLDALICAGDVLGLFNTERKDKVLFPRGEPFLVELDGILTIPAEKKHQKENHDAIGTGNGNGNGVAGTIGAATSTSTSTANGAAKTEPTASNSSANGNASAAPDDASSLSKEKNTALSLAARPVYCVETDSNPVTQIRRGEAVQIGGTWFRVSSDVKGHSKNQPVRARAPLSVVARRDIALSKNNKLDGFMQPFTSRVLPADAPLPPSAIENLRKAKEAREKLLKLAHGIRAGGASSQLLGTNAHSSNPVALASTLGTTHALGSRRRPQAGSGVGAASSASARAAAQEAMAKLKEAALDPYLSLYSHPRRHGCTKDVRELYLGTRSKVPDMDNKLRDELVEHKLLDPGEEMRRVRLQKRSNVDNDGKPKKRRYYERKNQRMTNTHLEGTEIGSLLKKATEKQQQGQAVGDGGM